MPIHDWSRVDAGVFHSFHRSWITALSQTFNHSLLSQDYYALIAPTSGVLPDFIMEPDSATKDRIVAETDMAFYRRKQNTVTVRHISGDRVVAMVEVVSPSNKASRNPLRSFVEKAAELMDNGIHLLILDLQSPGPRDPQGIHGVIWEEFTGEEYTAPSDKPLTLAAYEAGLTVRAYVEPVAVGDVLRDMPLFLEPGGCVHVPLEATYQAAWNAVPRRWQRVLATSAP
jgi:hypothetical protein